MSSWTKFILAFLPGVLMALRLYLISNTTAAKTYRSVCVAIVKAARQIEPIYADDPTFEEEVNK